MTAVLLLAGAILGAALVGVAWMRDRQLLATTAARLEAERDAARQAAEMQRTTLLDTQAQLRDAFDALSRSALKDNRDDFLQHAGSLLAPMRDTLARVQQHLTDVDKAREGSFQAVASELRLVQRSQEQMRASAETLSRSLSSPNVRGAWGEMQLRRIVELAGMVEHCDFSEQVVTAGDNGSRQTPDLVVRLPGGISIVIDAKVPIVAYKEAAAATAEPDRLRALEAHARQLRDHIKTLGAKQYWKQFQPAPEYVVLFLPLEPLLQAAFEQDPGVFELAASLRVILATPMTLLALLKAAATGWRQQQIAENAEEIQQLGRELYERLSRVVEHLEALGKSVAQAGEHYNRFVASLEQQVLPSARRFKQLGVAAARQVPDELKRLDMELRHVSKPELTGRADQDSAEELVSASTRELF